MGIESRLLNAIGIWAIAIVLLFAFYAEFILASAACPLCLIQRLGFIGVMFGMVLNLLYGIKPRHYSISIGFAIFGGAVALRQVALHVIPGTPTYGSAVLGLHFYTWAFILFVTIIVSLSMLNAISACDSEQQKRNFTQLDHWSQSAILIACAVSLGNFLASTLSYL